MAAWLLPSHSCDHDLDPMYKGRMESFNASRTKGKYVWLKQHDPGVTAVTSLGTRPFVRGRRKGSGHHLTFELSPGRNVDLTNQKR